MGRRLEPLCSVAWSTPSWSPSIVPQDDHDVHLVVDDLGRLGRVWREGDVEATGFETVIHDMLDGQYTNPIEVFAFNPVEGWSRDVSEDVARELRRRCGLDGREVPQGIRDLVDRHGDNDQGQLTTNAWTLRVLQLCIRAEW